jgi:hypothetical protein
MFPVPKQTVAKVAPTSTMPAHDPLIRRGPGPAPKTAIRVRAIQMGYYGDMRRRVGDVFTITDEALFSKRWMERVDPATPETMTTSGEALKRVHADIRSGKSPLGVIVPPDDTPADLRDGTDNPLGEE